jgi:hypothetical protein
VRYRLLQIIALAFLLQLWSSCQQIFAEVILDNLANQYSADFKVLNGQELVYGAQSFYSGFATRLTRVDLNLHQFGGGGTFFVRVQQADSNGKPGPLVPGGNLLAGKRIDDLGYDVSNAFSLTNLSLGLQVNQTYYIVVGRETNQVGNGELLWGYSSDFLTNSVYSLSKDGGITWGTPQVDSPQRIRIECAYPAPIIFPSPTNKVLMVASENLHFTNAASRADGNKDGLTYRLIIAPAGMVIDSYGAIDWKPTAAQASSTNLVTTVVTDGNILLTNTFFVVVLDSTIQMVNQPPIFAPISELTISELVTFEMQIEADDPDGASSLLRFELLDGPPNMDISNTGLLRWIPTESQGPGRYRVLVRATDAAVPSLSSTNQIIITVQEVNQPPIFLSPREFSVDELCDFVVTNITLDEDFPEQPLNFRLLAAPKDAYISVDGVIRWTPDETFGNTSNRFVAVASDGLLTATNSFVVYVREVNQPPKLYVPPSLTVLPCATWQLDLRVIDEDLPYDSVKYRLEKAPSGMQLDANTGRLTWVPSVYQCPTTNEVTVIVSDSGIPSLCDTQTFTICVSEPTPPVVVDTLQLSRFADFAFPDHRKDALCAQSFNSGSAAWVTGIALNLHRLGAGSGNFSVWLYDSISNGVPGRLINGGELVLNQSVASLSDSTNGIWTLRNLTIPIKPRTEYFVIVGYSDLAGEGMRWSYTSGAALGSAFNQSDDNGISWQPFDAYFPQQMRIDVSVNTSPVICTLTNLNATELTTFTTNLLAIDSESPPAVFTWDLISAPVGVSLNTTNGQLVWTPTEQQGPSTNLIIVRVTDNGIPSLSSTNQITIFVQESNTPPSLSVPSNTSINECLDYVAAVQAVDVDFPYNQLTYRLVTAPSGMSIDQNSGLIRWTPSEMQAPETYQVSVQVQDNGIPTFAVTKSFSLTVKEVNTPPSLKLPTNSIVRIGQAFAAVAIGSDSDWPTNNLTYSVVNAPAGLTMGSKGNIQWSPGSASASTTNVIRIRVTDNGRPSLSVTNSFTLTVLATNQPLLVSVVPDQTIDELSLLTVTNLVINFGSDSDNIGYRILQAPDGASVTSDGVVSWLPTEEQGPSTNCFVTVVTDDNKCVTNRFIVKVREVNRPPVMEKIADLYINEFETLTLTNAATDFDVPAQSLLYRLGIAPDSATVDERGVIRWVPGENYGGTTNVFLSIASDGEFEITNTFRVIVREVNQAPIFIIPRIVSIYPEESFKLTINAFDADLPSQQVRMRLLEGPVGMVFDSLGNLQWIPTPSQVGTNWVILEATDGIAVSKYRFSVEVVAYPSLNLEYQNYDSILLTWGSRHDRFYRVEYTDNLMSSSWEVLTDIEEGQRSSVFITNCAIRNSGFYRLVVLPIK